MIHKIESLEDLHNDLGYPSPQHPLISIIDLADIAVSKERKNVKIVSDFYTITLKTKVANAKLRYGREYYDFQNGTMVFLAPGQVNSIDQEIKLGEMQGWSLYFHPDLIRNYPLYRANSYFFNNFNY